MDENINTPIPVSVNDFISWIKSKEGDEEFMHSQNPMNTLGECIYYDPECDNFCLIGLWLHEEIGLTKNYLHDIDGIQMIPSASQLVNTLEDDGVISLEGDVANFKSVIDLFQQSADEKNADECDPFTWGEAVKSAMNHMPVKKAFERYELLPRS